MNEDKLIELSDVSMQWGTSVVLQAVNLVVNRNDFIAITGPNGGGKTTLLRIILKLLKPTVGTVTYYNDCNKVKELPIGYLPQKNMIDTRFPVTVREVVGSGLLGCKGLGRDELRETVGEMVERMGLTVHIDQPIGNLSGGQLQRTLLGRALISNPHVLVLDEPLSYVDKRFEHRIYEIVASLAGDTTILLVSHEMSTISGMANRHFIIDHRLDECRALHHETHCDCDQVDKSF